MSTYNIYATAIISLVAFGGGALAILFWNGAIRVGDRRLKFVAAGFAMLLLKGLFSIYTIQAADIHHEVTETIGALFEAAMVAFFVAPFWMRDR